MSDNKQFMCVEVGVEEYAIPLLAVQEVMSVPSITKLPMCPPAFKGLANVRGLVLPVYDMRTKLGMKPIESKELAMVLLDHDGQVIGIVVDKVSRIFSTSVESQSTNFQAVIAKNPMVAAVFQDKDKLVLRMRVEGLLTESEKSFARQVIPTTVQKAG